MRMYFEYLIEDETCSRFDSQKREIFILHERGFVDAL